VASLDLDPEPGEQLDRLHASDPDATEVVEKWLDLLEADPGAAIVRRRLLRPARLWYVRFRLTATEDWMILWELENEIVVVRALGPDVL
jgi:hypothetical protein